MGWGALGREPGPPSPGLLALSNDPSGHCPSPASAHSCPCVSPQGPTVPALPRLGGWQSIPQEGDNPARAVGAASPMLALLGESSSWDLEQGELPGAEGAQLSPGEVPPPGIPKSSAVPKPPTPERAVKPLWLLSPGAVALPDPTTTQAERWSEVGGGPAGH